MWRSESLKAPCRIRHEDAMDLHQLRTFIAVAQEENVTRAAERLYLSPPAVSAHISALEAELNVRLFQRSSKGMRLTDEGRALRSRAEQILAATRDMVEHARVLQNELSGALRVGVNASPSYLRLADLALTLQAEHPHVSLHFVESVSGRIIDALLSDRLDAGYLFGPPPHSAIHTVPLTQARLVIAAPAGWADQVEGAGWSDLAALPWIAQDDYCPFQEMVDSLFRARGLSHHQRLQASSEATKLALVASGVGLALLEETEAVEAAQAGKIAIWDEEPLECPLSFAYLASRQHDPLIGALVDAMRCAWEGGG
jgi:DNA-binding transcriptional LysR family regulator